MSGAANPMRGEASLTIGGIEHKLRPSFTALVAAEDELGSLFAMVEQASDGQLTIAQIAALFWHCLPPEGRPNRDAVGSAVLKIGLVEAAKPLRIILSQIVKGSG